MSKKKITNRRLYKATIQDDVIIFNRCTCESRFKEKNFVGFVSLDVFKSMHLYASVYITFENFIRSHQWCGIEITENGVGIYVLG